MGLTDELRLLRHARDWRGRARVPRSAREAEPAEADTAFRTAWARTEVAGVARSMLQRGVLTPLTWTQTRPQVNGRDYLTEVRGPAIFVANHSSHLDTSLILGSLPSRITDRLAVGAAADYFFDSQLGAATTALLFNAFPVQRRGGRRARSLAGDLVDEGWNLLLYPEGGRTPDGWMRMFQLGAAQLCVLKRVPAVPIAVRGTYAAMPPGRRWPQPGRPWVTVRFGRPLYLRPDEGVREFRVRLVQAVARLWAEQDLGWYGALRAAADGTLPVPGTQDGALPSVPVGKPPEPEAASWRRMWEATRPLTDERRRRVWD